MSLTVFDFLLILMILSWGAVLLFSVRMIRRIRERFDTHPGAEKGVPPGRRGGDAREGGKTPLITFDEAREVFRWEGTFEDKKATYTHSGALGHASLRIEAAADTLTVACFPRDFQEDDASAWLPYRVEVNARTVYRSDLLEGEAEPLVRRVLEGYFERGLKTGIDALALPQMEALETLLFGYRTYRRFIEFLGREQPDFLRQLQEYRGKPLLELLEPFRGGKKSREELLIEMRRAVSEEDYERAAIIRDRLRALEDRREP